MLDEYITQVQTLLHDPYAQFYPPAVLTGFINEARQQIALEGECIRGLGGLATLANQNLYQNSAVAVPATPAGIAGLITPRTILYGTLPLENRSWDWFMFYWLGLAKPPGNTPAAWCPFLMGGATTALQATGSFYVGPIPAAVYSLTIDGVWFPEDLATDATPEAIPYPWTDAVQFYATFLAYLDSQRGNDARTMYETYELFMTRARGVVTPLREQKTFPGGLAARTPPGMAPAEGTPPRGGR